MKIRYKKLILFLSLCFSMLIGLTISSHAYYVNSDGNLVSSNLIDESSLSFNQYTSTGQFSQYRAFTGYHTFLNTGTYTFSSDIFEDSFQVAILGNSAESNYSSSALFDTGYNSLPFTFTLNQDLYCGFYFKKTVNNSDQIFNASDLSQYNYMLNTGSSALAYEPYGVTFYSQSNYDSYGDNRYSVGFSDAIQYDSVSPVSMENLSECTYYVNGSSGSSSGWFERTFILNGSLVDSSGAAEDDGFNTSYGLFSGTQSFVDFVLDDYGIHLTSETPSELGQESYIEFVLSRAYSSDIFSCTLGLAFTHLDCFDFTGALVYSFANDNSSIVNRNYVLSNIPLSNISVFKLYFNQDTVLDESPVFLNISPLESAFNSGYLKGISDNSLNYEYGRQKYKEGYEQGKLDTQNSSAIAGSNFQKLIWTIGSTPFESFKTIWNVDVMGLNISGIILGGLMALLVLYLIKKIWK